MAAQENRDELLNLYHAGQPAFLTPFLETPELLRLRGVGMNCGCEYTAFPRFCRLPRYSRFSHSLGAALIVWHFTGDKAQTLSALFHDLATPVFAHVVDFLRGDYLRQEATEARTEEILRGSAEIGRLLEELAIPVEAVTDYHRYPVADNDAPRLSSDRLEYTMGNALGFGFASMQELAAWYGELRVAAAPDGQIELGFGDARAALGFARTALRCSRVYVSDEDRYAMQMLSELLAEALRRGVIDEGDLYATEAALIEKLERDESLLRVWRGFRALRRMRSDEAAPPEKRRVIPAKKRFIDPLVVGCGRASALDKGFRRELERFLSEPQDGWLCGE
ncbi:MAG: hypothetical protein K6G17_01815 [Oscillospiraceae bacterium]|nr:hypothetical protein [Oscillospiraceae bacterium]